VAKLGEGGMALVHLAVVRGLAGTRKLVVLKSVRPELLAEENIRNMFVEEARVATTLSHPNIVQTFEIAVSNGGPVLVMEYLEGQNLGHIRRRMRSGIVPLAPSAPLALQLFVLKGVLAGLEYAHNCKDLEGTALKLVHRDVSPQNVFVTYDGQVKILDFGIAKSAGTTGRSVSGNIKGKIRYMAPEQMVASVDIDGRADVYGVGVMLWEALTQRRLWDGLADVHVIQKVLGNEVALADELPRDVPPLLGAICRRALARDCNERYESAAAMRSDLERAIDDLGLRISMEEVGKVVSESFAELRASVRTQIEQQLRDERTDPIDLPKDDDVISGDPWRIPLAATRSMPVRARRRRSALLRSAGVAVLLTGVAVLLTVWVGHYVMGSGTRGAPADGHARAAASDAPAGEGRHPETDSFRAPASASGGVAVAPTTPAATSESAAASGSPAAGPTSSAHASEANSAHKGNKADGSRAPIGRTRSVTPPARSAETDRSCALPYYFDDQGIKRLRPECFK
jgi:serine/threonine protein kinase